MKIDWECGNYHVDDDELLRRLNFCIDIIKEDKSIDYSTTAGKMLSVEEIMGVLLASREFVENCMKEDELENKKTVDFIFGEL